VMMEGQARFWTEREIGPPQDRERGTGPPALLGLTLKIEQAHEYVMTATEAGSNLAACAVFVHIKHGGRSLLKPVGYRFNHRFYHRKRGASGLAPRSAGRCAGGPEP